MFVTFLRSTHGRWPFKQVSMKVFHHHILYSALKRFPPSALSDPTFKTYVQRNRPGTNGWFCGNNGFRFVHLRINSLAPGAQGKVPHWQSTGADTSQRAFVSLWWISVSVSVLCLRFMRLSGGSTVRQWWIIWGESGKSTLLSTVYNSQLLIFLF